MKITYKGEEYQDRLVITSRFEIPFFQRLLNLFRPTLTVEHEVYCKEEMPTHKCSGCELNFLSYWDRFRVWWADKRGLNKMESNS